jgi:hypothetical protein
MWCTPKTFEQPVLAMLGWRLRLSSRVASHLNSRLAWTLRGRGAKLRLAQRGSVVVSQELKQEPGDDHCAAHSPLQRESKSGRGTARLPAWFWRTTRGSCGSTKTTWPERCEEEQREGRPALHIPRSHTAEEGRASHSPPSGRGPLATAVALVASLVARVSRMSPSAGQGHSREPAAASRRIGCRGAHDTEAAENGTSELSVVR